MLNDLQPYSEMDSIPIPKWFFEIAFTKEMHYTEYNGVFPGFQQAADEAYSDIVSFRESYRQSIDGHVFQGLRVHFRSDLVQVYVEDMYSNFPQQVQLRVRTEEDTARVIKSLLVQDHGSPWRSSSLGDTVASEISGLTPLPWTATHPGWTQELPSFDLTLGTVQLTLNPAQSNAKDLSRVVLLLDLISDGTCALLQLPKPTDLLPKALRVTLEDGTTVFSGPVAGPYWTATGTLSVAVLIPAEGLLATADEKLHVRALERSSEALRGYPAQFRVDAVRVFFTHLQELPVPVAGTTAELEHFSSSTVDGDGVAEGLSVFNPKQDPGISTGVPLSVPCQVDVPWGTPKKSSELHQLTTSDLMASVTNRGLPVEGELRSISLSFSSHLPANFTGQATGLTSVPRADVSVRVSWKPDENFPGRLSKTYPALNVQSDLQTRFFASSNVDFVERMFEESVTRFNLEEMSSETALGLSEAQLPAGRIEVPSTSPTFAFLAREITDRFNASNMPRADVGYCFVRASEVTNIFVAPVSEGYGGELELFAKGPVRLLGQEPDGADVTVPDGQDLWDVLGNNLTVEPVDSVLAGSTFIRVRIGDEHLSGWRSDFCPFDPVTGLLSDPDVDPQVPFTLVTPRDAASGGAGEVRIPGAHFDFVTMSPITPVVAVLSLRTCTWDCPEKSVSAGSARIPTAQRSLHLSTSRLYRGSYLACQVWKSGTSSSSNSILDLHRGLEFLFRSSVSYSPISLFLRVR